MENSQPVLGETTLGDSQSHAGASHLFGGKGKALIIIIFLVICALGYAFYAYKGRMGATEYKEQYTLVPDKISASAPITVILPEDVTFANFEPSKSLSFSPEIKGRWETTPTVEKNTYLFTPETKLPVGAYYRVSLVRPELTMEKMFSVDNDPTVLAILPKEDAEVSEYANITIMFSRPMVSLSTLSENADVTVPVTITPATEGRFKWITTRTLQFTPTKRLARSATYTVRINEGLRSAEGILVPPEAHTFTTRTLAYQMDGTPSSAETLAHDQPLRIYFNQPVDVTRTESRIRLTTPASPLPQQFVLGYGTRLVQNEETGKTERLTDRSILEVFPLQDSHGRSYLWEFDQTYTLVISGAVPLEGDIALNKEITRRFTIVPIISGTKAESPRSANVTPQVFDPTGTLIFTMSEPVDLSASRITGKGVASVVYGQRCKEPEAGEEVWMNTETCAKVDDKKSLIVSFSPQAFGLGETSSVVFERLVNTNGVTLNSAPLTEQFTTYAPLRVVRSTPQEGETSGDLTEMQLCTTNPLVRPADDDFYKKVRSNMMIGMWNWNNSFLVQQNHYEGGNKEMCPVGTFQTTIRYGLVPLFAYTLTMDLSDHFGQTLTHIVHFTTKDADPLAKGITHLQPTVVMTSPTRTVLTYGLDFMNEVDVAVCKVSPETMLQYRAFSPGITSGSATLNCLERKMKHITLPTSPATRKYLQVDVKEYFQNPLGHYVIVLSNPGYHRVSREWNYKTQSVNTVIGDEQLFEKTFLTVTNLAVGSKQVERVENYYYSGNEKSLSDSFMAGKWPTNLYWVNEYATLNGVLGALVTQYAKNDTAHSLDKINSVFTGNEGIAQTPSGENLAGAVVTTANDSAIVSNYSDALSWSQAAGASRREYLYTDRPIYRPGDTVHIKGISRIGYDAQFEIPTGNVTLEVRNARYEIMRTERTRFNKNGTYEVTLTLDPKAPLGYYSFSSDTGGYGSFQVEEYVAPDFTIDLTPNKEEYTSGDTLSLGIGARYYFGVPLGGGTAEYRIVSQEYYFDRYKDDYFNFGRSWYDNTNGWYGDQFITAGKLKLSREGKGVITQELSIDKLFTGNYKNQSKILTVYVTVKNENGQSVTKQQSLIVHRGTFYAGITLDSYFYGEEKEGRVRIKTVSVKGEPVSENNLTLILEKVDWKSYKRQEVDGNFYYRTERTKTKVKEVSIDTDRKGDGMYDFVTGDAGEYEFTIRGTDDKGNVVSAQYDFYVSGNSAVAIRPTNNATLELVPEKTELSVGETGAFVIKSPFPRGKALITLARGKTYDYALLNVDSQLTRYQFVTKEEYIPNLVASALLLSPDPDMKYGEVYYTVGTDEKELSIEITPSKKTYLPGEEVSLDILAKNKKGEPVQAELSLSVVDMSVLALVGNPKKDPISFFYGGEPLTIRTAMNVKNILHVAEVPTGTKGGSGGGGDDLEKKKRGVFRDTAYWNGVVDTDREGKAHVTFTLPDNLTQWQVESVGVTTSTKVGVGYADLTARKPVMAIPARPRFILPGDSLSIGGTIFNETETTQKLTVAIGDTTLDLSGIREMSVSLEPHTSLTVSFPATAPLGRVEGNHEFTLKVSNAMYQDVVTSQFPIEHNDTFEFTATAGRVTNPQWKEYLYLPTQVLPDRGELSISLSGTMATMLDTALRGMIIYPYECSEQVGSKLRTIALMKQNEKLFVGSAPLFTEKYTVGNQEYTIDEIVTKGLAKLYESQRGDGGMPYYPMLEPDYRLTLATLETYIDLQKAGYTVDEKKIAQAAQFVFNYINFPGTKTFLSREDIITGAYVLGRLDSSVGSGRWESANIRAQLIQFASDKTVRSNLSTPALAYLATLAATENFGNASLAPLLALFENRSHVDARGTTVGANKETPSLYTENAMVDTALALKAFALARHETPLLEGYVRALKTGKTRDGGWGSTYNTIIVIDGMTEYLKWKNEANGHANITATLDGKDVLALGMTPATIRTTVTKTIPMTELKRGVQQILTFNKKEEGKDVSAYYYDVLLKYFLPTQSIAPRDEGISVRRGLYAQDDVNFAHPLTSASQGDVLRGRIIISVPTTRAHVSLEDFIPAGVEIVNQRLATEDQGLKGGRGGALGVESENRETRSWLGRTLLAFSLGADALGPNQKSDGLLSDDAYGNRDTRLKTLYPSAVESHDDRLFLYVGTLPAGEYVYEYYVRALIPGTYQYLPLVARELYTPENFGRTEGSVFTVTKKTD